jgi:hypothetical protein
MSFFIKLQQKRRVLQKFVTTSDTERRKNNFLAKSQSGNAARDFINEDRWLDFLAACLRDRQETGKSREEIEDFFVRLSEMDDDDLDTLVILCTEVADGSTWVLPGSTLNINKLSRFKKKLNPNQRDA